MNVNNLRYCLLQEGIDLRLEVGACITGWVEAFNGDLLRCETFMKQIVDNHYDLIHIRLCLQTLPIISRVHAAIMQFQAKAKIIVSIDCDIAPLRKSADETLILALQLADFCFATEYSIALTVEQIICKKIHILTHPIKRPHQRNDQAMSPSVRKTITVVGRWQDVIFPRRVNWLRYWMQLIKVLLRWRFRLKVYAPSRYVDIYRSLDCSQYFLYLDREPSYGPMVINASAKGLISFAYVNCASISFCSQYGQSPDIHRMFNVIDWLERNAEAKAFALSHTKLKSVYFNTSNSVARLWARCLETEVIRADNCFVPPYKSSTELCFVNEIHQLSGKSHVSYKSDEVVLVAIGKNVVDYLPCFLNHYRALGVKHFYIIDNMSTDGTVEFLYEHEDVTLYQTTLKHHEYENEIKTTIIERHCSQRWFLCVDLDELFEYPHWETVKLNQLIDYLSRSGYTSVLTYMLDMFVGGESAQGRNVQQHYQYFDISNVDRREYFNDMEGFYARNNRLADNSFQAYYGGIRQLFLKPKDSVFSLVKHSLMYRDQYLEPIPNPHYCNNSYVADVSAVVKHYKLLTFDTKKNTGHEHSFAIQSHVEAYSGVKNFPNSSANQVKYQNSQQLVDMGFMRISQKYGEFLQSLISNAKFE